MVFSQTDNNQSRDSEYILFATNNRFQEDRDFVESLWSKFSPFADSNFLSALKADFHARYWEMYLGNLLLDNGFELNKKNGGSGPDLITSFDKKDVFIEITAATGGVSPDAIERSELKPGEIEFFSVPDEKVVLRYRSSIEYKFNKYETYIKNNLVSVFSPYIIALNGNKVPFSELDDNPPHIIQALFGIGDPYVTFNKNTNKVIGQGFAHRPFIKKQNQSAVQTQIFLDQKYMGITGIIFSRSGLLNRPKIFGSDIVFIHNPMAKNPLPIGWLGIGKEYFCENGYVKINRK